ncbi:MAG: aminotransferase class V-fold PLP-dependent enzyme [Polymorphobacter sp.]
MTLPTRAALAALDAADPLAFARARFTLPPGIIYLDGNSLGPLPAATPGRLAAIITGEWGEGLIRSWNDSGWIDLPMALGAGIAPLLGAAPESVVACDSVSVNLFKLAGGALALQQAADPGRRVLLCEADDFPTDRHVLEGLAAATGAALRTVPRGGVPAALGADVAVAVLAHVHFATGAVHDMAALSAQATAAGALSLWDLSHSAGALALALDADGADFAVGCGYKYLNGGPGAPAFAYVAERHHSALWPPLRGWMGHAAPFGFSDHWTPADGVRRLLAGTPSILALAALGEGIATFDGIGMTRAEAKSRSLVMLFAELVTARCPAVTVEPPGERHGAQVILRHPEGRRVMAALIARGVIGDFRPPDRLRFGFPALYTRFAEVFDAVDHLDAVLASGEWQDGRFDVLGVVS